MRQQITMLNQENLTFDEALELFIRKCKVKNLTDNSIISYRQKLKPLQTFMGGNTPIESVTSTILDDFILYMREESNANEITINSYLRSIRAFLYYCMECGYLKQFKIHMTKCEKKIKETYTDDELERLLAKPDINECTFTEYKTWVFENFLLGTGNRISTALNVKIKDVIFEDGIILLCKTKSRKQQILPLSNTLASILQEYLTIRGGKEDDYLFCNVYGEQSSRTTYQQLVRHYNIKRNVNKTSCHLFRHTFAKNWILSGGDIFRLQKILGHSDLTVTKEYVQMFGQDLQLDFEKFNPLDNMKKKTNQIKM